ncbi:hypothetical protein [Paenibacillus tengchongensis]|uniref:hypothetical protein n=1 Tax=Paenibacillus tengchongensis TaxID=2608684 RepID=UPI00124C9084|nr:hypothetical protein [Paenibacillus tengchongensis]
MDQEQLPDLVLGGMNSAGGGRYNQVRLEGMSTIHGPLQARMLKADGMMTLDADVLAAEMDADGKLTVKGNLEGGRLTLDGMLSVHGDLRCGTLQLNGMSDVKGGCDVEELRGEGGFTVGGLLSAGMVDFMLQGQGKAERIGARSLVIRRSPRAARSKLLSGLFPKFKAGLKAELIEGESVQLEYTEAGVVTGGTVSIGPGCDIGLVEYRDTVHIHPEARVGKVERIAD